MKTKRIVVKGDQYEITCEDNSIIKCGTLVSKGTKQKKGEHFDHMLNFSDGISTKFVASLETITIPDCSLL